LHRFVGGLLLALTLVAGSVLPVHAATKVSTSLSETGGYARMVFNWPDAMPAHSETISSGVLIVKFEKPIAVDMELFAQQMPNTVALARLDADGKTLRFGLKVDFRLNAQQAENALYVDLLPSSWSGAPPSLPAEVVAKIKAVEAARVKIAADEKRARDRGIVDPVAPLPDLNVRVAQHDGMTRLVFDWNQPVLYSVAQQDGSATITFDRTAKVALAQIRVNPPPLVQSISAMERGGRLSVFIKLDSGVAVSDFREDLGVVLDFKPMQANNQSAVDAPKHAEAVPADAAADHAAEPTHATPGDAAPVDAHAAAKDHEVAATHAPETVDEPVAPVADAHAPKLITPKVAEAQPEEPAKVPEPAHEQVPAHEPEPVLPVAEGMTEAEVSPVVPDAETLVVTSAATENRSELTFPWREATGAAVFERSGIIWVVFDRAAKLDLAALEHNPARGFGQPVVLAVDGATVLAFPKTLDTMLVGVEEAGTVWRVSLAHSLASTGRSIALTRSWSASGEGYVSADLAGTSKIISFDDPQVRDTLQVATARGMTQSLQASRSYIEFKALKSAQGLAIARIADDLNVAAAPDAVIISRHNGLTLSTDSNNSPRPEASMNSASPAKMLFETWRGHGDFQPNKQAFVNLVAMAEPSDEAAARLDYARFLLGHHLASEAVVQLRTAAKGDFRLESDPAFRALRGVGEVLSHRNALAIDDLSTATLDLDPYAAAWRGLARAELGQFDQANKDFDFAGSFINELDPDIAARMHLAAADAAMMLKDYPSAHNHLAAVPADLTSNALQAETLVMRGRLLEGLGKPLEAEHVYDSAIALNDREQTTRARLNKALLLNSAGKLDDEKLLAELDRLRVMWRGGTLELNVLTVIGQKALAQGKIVDALGAMRAAVRYFPLSNEAQVLGAKMPEIFADYFIGPGSKEMSGVQALAFYYNFQDLTPIGQRGDELIRNLAERLVSIDLLAQAEVLLRYQVEQRLYGSVAKAQVSARLAGVYLLDDKPKDALQILRATTQNQLPADLRNKRQMLEARALASLKQFELALDLLSEIDNKTAESLRAEIYWESESWDAAGQAHEAIAEDSLKGVASDLAFSDDTRFNIMRSAIAYSLGANAKGLTRLRTKFGPRMSTSVDASAFAVVSDPIETSGVAFRQLASKVAAVDMIEKFVTSLKDDAEARASAVPAKAATVEPDKNVAVN
tara:strand:- start:68 stop:3661 length:3594 start_codon:yes stop_codon:yes gene_type:complete